MDKTSIPPYVAPEAEYPPDYPGNKALGRVFRALENSDIFDGKHTAEPTEYGRLKHTVTWTQRPSPAGT